MLVGSERSNRMGQSYEHSSIYHIHISICIVPHYINLDSEFLVTSPPWLLPPPLAGYERVCACSPAPSVPQAQRWMVAWGPLDVTRYVQSTAHVTVCVATRAERGGGRVGL